jgi:hypothetical protein
MSPTESDPRSTGDTVEPDPRASRSTEEPTRQTTLVAWYGPKRDELRDVVLDVQRVLEAEFSSAFESYAIDQVHLTITGLESLTDGSGTWNENFLSLRGEHREPSAAALLEFLRGTDRLPMKIRVGGFEAGIDQGFTSRGLHPSERSFGLRGAIAVVMGWPWHESSVSPGLDRLRRDLQTAGVLHKYHAHDTDEDNDAYFVVGRVVLDPTDAARREAALRKVRDLLSRRAPVEIEIDQQDLAFVSYVDTRLPRDSSEFLTLDTATPAALARFFRRSVPGASADRA